MSVIVSTEVSKKNFGGELSPETAVSFDPLIGRVFEARYEIIERLGEGAMGVVYEVEHINLKKRFAMKVIRDDLARDRLFAARFEREAMLTSKMTHPNCISVTDFGRSINGELFLVMEYLDGQPLSEMVGTPLPLADSISITKQILLALIHAHSSDLIHRDIKPENVFIVPDHQGGWHVKVLDFGIAVGATASSDEDSLLAHDRRLIAGTPAYMSPEQARADNVDERSDIYATGAIMWEMLIGSQAFDLPELIGQPDVSPKQATSLVQAVELVRLKQSFAVPSLEKVVPGVFSHVFYEVIDRALAHEKTLRFSCADEFLRALAPFSDAPKQALCKKKGPISRLGWYWQKRLSHRVTPSPALTLEKCRAESRKRWYHIVLPYSNHGWFWVTAIALLLAIGGGWTSWLVRANKLPALLSKATGDINADGFATPILDRYKKRIEKNYAEDATGPIQLSSASRARLAARLLNQGLCEEAALVLEQMDTTLGAEPGPWLNKGMAEICLGRNEAGLNAYRRLIHIDGKNRSNPQIISEVGHLIEREQSRKLALKFASAELDMSSIANKQTSLDPKIRHSVVKMLKHMGRDDLIDSITVLQLDLDQTVSCGKRASIAAELSQITDQRALWVLKNAKHQRLSDKQQAKLKHQCILKQLDKSIAKLESDLNPTM